jgi:hypothetical protein
MSADESFLARWSRRKREAAQPTPDQPKSENAEAKPPLPDEPPPPPPAADSTFDPVSLPPIASIGAGSDLSRFLAPDVPVELARAALRQAWSADPAIREFVGLSENAWDFVSPDGVPGFTSIAPDEVRRLLARAVGEPGAAASAREGADQAPEVQTSAKSEAKAAPDQTALVSSTETNAAAPQQESSARDLPSCPRRHGGALPT